MYSVMKRIGKASVGLIGLRAVAALVVVVVVLALWGAVELSTTDATDAPPPDAASANDGEWFFVARRSFDMTVVASGELEARDQVEVKSEVGGRVAIVEIVEEGTFVKEGDFIAKLEDDAIQDKIEEEVLRVETARASKIAAEQEFEIAINETQSDAKAAEVKLALAKLDLAKWLNGEVKQKRRELDLALEKAERRVTRAVEDLELSKELHEQQFISRNELDDSVIEELEAKNALETAKLDIEVYEEFAYNRDSKQKNSDVEQAEAGLERTLRKNDSRVEKLQADLDSKRRTLSIREGKLEDLNTQFENTRIVAPRDGLVVYASSVGPHWRRRDPIIPGRQIRFNETIVLLPDTRQMVASLRVHEALLPQVEEGQQVNVTIDARPTQPFGGEVLTIAIMAEDGGWLNPQLREYKVRVALPAGADESLKPGMRCSGEVLVGRVDNAIAVPVQAVFTEGDERFCYVPSGRQVRRQVVTIGKASEAYVEILDGLEPGVRVLMRSPRPGEIAG